MKNTILDNIEDFRNTENGFDENTMRWSKWYVDPQIGLVKLYSKKDRANNKDAVRLGDMSREALAKLDNDVLLTVYTQIVRQMFKQM